MNKRFNKLISISLLITSGVAISECIKLRRKSKINRDLLYKKISISKLISVDTVNYTVVIRFDGIDKLYTNFLRVIKNYQDIEIPERTSKFIKLDLSKSKLKDFTIDEVKIFIMDMLDLSYIDSIK